MKCYILSLKHTRPKDLVFTWWGPDSKGYTTDLTRAGLYEEEEVEKSRSYFNNAIDTLAIKQSDVEKMATKVVMNESRYLRIWRNEIKDMEVK